MEIKLEELKEKEQACIMRTYARKPVLFVRGAGTHLWDDQGREYLDFVSGLGACVTGHAHPRVAKAVAEQAAQLIQVSNLYYTRPQVELAGVLIEKTFADKAFFCNSGTEACEGAIKLARKYMKENGREGRFEIITALRSFHGRTMGSLTATGQPEKAEPFAPLLPGFKHVPFNDLAALEQSVSGSTCAVMLEPIQGEGGVYVAGQHYLQSVKKLCEQEGILFILDEVQTGMGRTGALFACEHYGVDPDIMTVSKGLGSGLPIGTILATEEVAAAFKPGDHGTTFGGGPVPCAAALATFEILEKEGLIANAAGVGAYFKEQLTRIQQTNAEVTEVRGMGLMLAIELAGECAPDITQAALERGFVINHIGTGTLRFLPPLAVTTAEVDTLLEVLRELLQKEV